MTDDELRELPNVERHPSNKAPIYQVLGGVAGNLASNILATIFSPTTGAILAAVAIVCWGFSAYPLEKYLKARLRASPFTLGLIAMFFLGTFVFTCTQSIRVYERIRLDSAKSTLRNQPNCQGPTGPAIASGNGNVANSGNCNDINSKKSK